MRAKSVTLADTRANRVCFETYAYDVPACRVNRESREQRTHIDHVRARARVCTRARVRARLYAGLVPCLSYQTTGHNSARELDARPEMSQTRGSAPHLRAVATLRRYTRGAKVRACVDLSASFEVFQDLRRVYSVPMNLTRMAHERRYTRADVFAKLRRYTQIPN